jgi:hypothetical protein
VREPDSPGQAGGQLVLPGVDVFEEAIEVRDPAGRMESFRELGCSVDLVFGIKFKNHHFRCGELGIVPVQWFRQELSLQ